MFERFTDRARRVVVLAQLEARRLDHNYIGTEHMLLGLIGDGEGVAAHVLANAGVTLEAVRAEILEVVGPGRQPASGHIPFTPRTKKILEFALREALDQGSEHIGTEHLLLGLIREREGVGAQLLGRFGGGLDAVREAVLAFAAQGSSEPEKPAPAEVVGSASGTEERTGSDAGASGERRTPFRGLFQRREGASVPVAREYVPGAPRPPVRLYEPVVERPQVTRRLLAALGRRERNNAVVVGPAGSGKTALVYGAGQWLSGNRGPASLHGMELVELDALVLQTGVDRMVRRASVAVVLVEDLGTLLAVDEHAGGHIAMRLSALADARSPLVLTASDAAYERFVQTYPSLAQRFAEVRLDEGDPAFTRLVLEARRPQLMAFHNVEIGDSALDAAIELGPIVTLGRAMPGCALDLIDTAAAHASAPSSGTRQGPPPMLDADALRSLVAAAGDEARATETPEDAAAPADATPPPAAPPSPGPGPSAGSAPGAP